MLQWVMMLLMILLWVMLLWGGVGDVTVGDVTVGDVAVGDLAVDDVAVGDVAVPVPPQKFMRVNNQAECGVVGTGGREGSQSQGPASCIPGVSRSAQCHHYWGETGIT